MEPRCYCRQYMMMVKERLARKKFVPWHSLFHKLWPASSVLAAQEETTRSNNPEQSSTWEEAVAELFREEHAVSSATTKEDDSQIGSIPDFIHIQQLSNWDCGVSCLQMVADWLETAGGGTDRGRNSKQRDWMLQQAGTESIWTVDLVWILHNLQSQEKLREQKKHHPFSYLFCSRILSVNEDLSEFNYYKDAFFKDRIRVQQRFDRLFQVQPAVLFQTTPQQLLLSHVMKCIQRSNCVAIALVDNQILMGHVGRPYSGHYVVLMGISHDFVHVERAMQQDELTNSTPASDAMSACLVVNNPGSKETVSYLTLPHFERAWRAPGTDQDIIFVVKMTE